MPTQISPHFTLEEMFHSDYALRNNIDNTTTDPMISAALTALAINVLEPIRNHYGTAFSPTSGYRCPQLNRAINGAVNSQHMSGQAADIVLPIVARFELAQWIEQALDFDQLILEYYTPGQPQSGWVHCSYVRAGANRKDVRTCPPGTTDYLPGLRP